jgi:hypothetical protein
LFFSCASQIPQNETIQPRPRIMTGQKLKCTSEKYVRLANCYRYIFSLRKVIYKTEFSMRPAPHTELHRAQNFPPGVGPAVLEV